MEGKYYASMKYKMMKKGELNMYVRLKKIQFPKATLFLAKCIIFVFYEERLIYIRNMPPLYFLCNIDRNV